MPTITPSELIVNRPSCRVDWAVVKGGDWNDEQSIVEATESGDEPLDLTGMRLQLVIRPAFEHATIIDTLDTATNEIAISDAPGGTFRIYIPADRVATWKNGIWAQTLTLIASSERREISRGLLYVYPPAAP